MRSPLTDIGATVSR